MDNNFNPMMMNNMQDMQNQMMMNNMQNQMMMNNMQNLMMMNNMNNPMMNNMALLQNIQNQMMMNNMNNSNNPNNSGINNNQSFNNNNQNTNSQQPEQLSILFRFSSSNQNNSNNGPTLTIQCTGDELVSEVIKRFRQKSGFKGKAKFVFNAKNLVDSLSVAEAGLANNNCVFVIPLEGIKGALNFN